MQALFSAFCSREDRWKSILCETASRGRNFNPVTQDLAHRSRDSPLDLWRQPRPPESAVPLIRLRDT
jgi:hypothetical protein